MRRLVGAVAACLLIAVASSCGGSDETNTTTTTNQMTPGQGVTVPSTTDGDTDGATAADMVGLMWYQNGTGASISVLPTVDDITSSYAIVENKGRTYDASIADDSFVLQDEALGQAVAAQGGGAWRTVWVLESSDKLGRGSVTVIVAILPRNGQIKPVLDAARTVVPAGAVDPGSVGGAPVGSWSAVWASATGGEQWAYLDATHGSVAVTCLASSSSVSMQNLCGGVVRYTLEGLNGKSL